MNTYLGKILGQEFALKLAREVRHHCFIRCNQWCRHWCIYAHSHPGGETYLVLEGEVWDEDGTYPGDPLFGWTGPYYTPRTRGQTLILVLWPDGVKALKPRPLALRSHMRAKLISSSSYLKRQAGQRRLGLILQYPRWFAYRLSKPLSTCPTV